MKKLRRLAFNGLLYASHALGMLALKVDPSGTSEWDEPDIDWKAEAAAYRDYYQAAPPTTTTTNASVTWTTPVRWR